MWQGRSEKPLLIAMRSSSTRRLRLPALEPWAVWISLITVGVLAFVYGKDAQLGILSREDLRLHLVTLYCLAGLTVACIIWQILLFRGWVPPASGAGLVLAALGLHLRNQGDYLVTSECIGGVRWDWEATTLAERLPTEGMPPLAEFARVAGLTVFAFGLLLAFFVVILDRRNRTRLRCRRSRRNANPSAAPFQ